VRRLSLAAILLVVVFSAGGQVNYFPQKVFSADIRLDQFVSEWYSSKLKILDEPSLLAMAGNHAAETYRFLWLRTFDKPVAVRLKFDADGSAVLLVKVASGTGGFPDKNTHLLQNLSRPVSRQQAQAFRRLLGKTDFWMMSSTVERGGMDGAEWIVEGVKHDAYHLVVRWSPDQGRFRELCMMLAFGLADLKIPKEDVY
jgi:hypothetical protein